ncbi:MAG TPA: amino acid adenylation domain-containing protein, partial [Caldithrix abyssi]|nr:amino acid adenylation domain-containing protein [Caldithrix abyssi]
EPQQNINRYSLLTTIQRRELLKQLQPRPAELDEPAVIHRWFEVQAQRFSAKTALVYYDRQLTFDELNRKANRLAHYLIDRGVKPETMVGISLNRSPEMVIALLGVLKAGGVYVPIDPNYPPERIRYILQDSGINLLLTQEALKDHFGDEDVEPVALDEQWQEIEAFPDANPQQTVLPENLAYMIYTSGSTGKPKGTMLQHRGLCNLTRFQIKDFKLDETSRVLQFASFSFDASVSEIFTTLISGGTLYLADREDMLPGPSLINLLKENEISVVTLPPSVSILLKNETFPALKTLISAGEACPPDLANHWSKGRRFLNAYGPTENTVCASSFAVTEEITAARVPIGKAIDNVQLLVLDESGNLLPPGVPGELHIGGLSLARGYFHQPALTAEKFIPNPYSETPGARLYKTGDLARYLPDGNLEFLGRIDHQVKVRGFRIELGEIESVLREHPAVAQAVVMAREGNLAAYLVAQSDAELNGETLRAFCRDRLPDYMVPAAFVELDEIPLTPNGKIDYRALPEPDFAALQSEDVFTAPRTSEEELLAGIFGDVLRLDRVSVTRSFFDMGGHSLLATQLVSRIRDVFGVDIPLISVFEAPSVAQLVTVIEQERLKQKSKHLPPLEPVPRGEDIPLSFAQQRLWFLDQLAPDNATYNIPTALKVIGAFDLQAFEKTLNFLVRRHETLRTTFGNKNGQPVQIIKPELTVRPQVVDLSGLAEEEKEARARELATADAMEPFDLEIGPLFRTKIVKLSDREHVVLFNMHHIISDGWSVSVLIREFASVYESYSKGETPRLPDLRIQYADFAAWQRAWLQGEVLEEQINYWKNTIGVNPEPLNLPTDFPRPPVQTFRGASLARNYP